MIRDKIRRIAEECCVSHAAHVVEVTLRGSQNKAIVEIFIDAESGVTTELCSKISRDVDDRLEEFNLIKGSYQLVVSSPGIERGLKFPWQYKKHVGRNLNIRTETGSRTGKLLAVDDNGVTLDVGEEELKLSFDAIREAIVQAPW